MAVAVQCVVVVLFTATLNLPTPGPATQVAAGPQPSAASIAARVDEYERRAADGSARPAELAAIGEAVIGGERRSDIPAILVAACASMFVPPSDECARNLAAAATNENLSLATRLEAVAAQIKRAVPGAGGLFDRLVSAVEPGALLAITSLLAEVPVEHGVPPLLRMLTSPDTRVQIAASRVLGGINSAPVLPALDDLARRSAPGSDAWLAVTTARARLGQPDALSASAGAHPLLGGDDLLEAARALEERGDPRGIEMLRLLTRNQSGLLQLRAGVLLRNSYAEVFTNVLAQALQSIDVAVRVEALAAYRDYPLPLPTGMPRLMLHADPLLRLRAAELAIAWAARQPSPHQQPH